MELVKKTYSRLREDFRLNKSKNFVITVSIGQTSQMIFDEWLARCFSNLSLDWKTRSHFSQ